MIGFGRGVCGRFGCFLLIAVFFALLMESGCAGSRPVKPSGFLVDYQRLRPDPEIEGVKWWERPGVDWKKYK